MVELAASGPAVGFRLPLEGFLPTILRLWWPNMRIYNSTSYDELHALKIVGGRGGEHVI